MLNSVYADCSLAECSYAECLYAKCRSAECHGAFLSPMLVGKKKSNSNKDK